MTPKEHSLALLKDIILLLKAKGKDMRDRLDLTWTFQKQHKKLNDILEKLTPEDRRWVDEEYSKWLKELVSPEKAEKL